MMRALLVLGTLWTVASGVAVAADTGAVVQKTLQADYDVRDRAVTRRDIDAILAQYAPDFVGVSQTGNTHDLKEERADFIHTFALPTQSVVSQSVIQKLVLTKAGTEADVTLHRHGSLSLPNPQTHALQKVVLDGVYQDVWSKRAKGWLLIREQAVSVSTTVDGKPL